MLRAIAIDDEPKALEVLKLHIAKVPFIDLQSTFRDPVQGLDWLTSHNTELVFLDINMPKLDGFQVINQLDSVPIVIFTTAYPEHAVKAFEVKAFDYLVKPVSFERFLKSCRAATDYLERSAKSEEKEGETILIKENKRLYKLSQKEIFFVKAFGDYIRIFTTSKTYIVKDRLLRFSTELNERFFQVHRSFIVNLDHIHYLEGNHLVINDEKVPVSDTYRNELIKNI